MLSSQQLLVGFSKFVLLLSRSRRKRMDGSESPMDCTPMDRTGDANAEIGLSIEAHREGNVWTMRLLGELDLSNVEQLEEAFRRAEAAEGVVEIILDLNGLEFVDSTGLKLLLEVSVRSRADSNRLQMRGAVGQVRRILEITEAYERMPFDE